MGPLKQWASTKTAALATAEVASSFPVFGAKDQVTTPKILILNSSDKRQPKDWIAISKPSANISHRSLAVRKVLEIIQKRDSFKVDYMAIELANVQEIHSYYGMRCV
jgi:hypothetical protein